MEDGRVLRAEQLWLRVYLGKMRPISGLEAVFQFLFLISSVKHGILSSIHTQRASMLAERPHALIRILQC